jgi:S1-C subfamily serine protease
LVFGRVVDRRKKSPAMPEERSFNMSSPIVFNRRKLAIVGTEPLSEPLIRVVTNLSSCVGLMVVDKGDEALNMRGTAFCVDGRGLFMTACHYIDGLQRATLVLDREYPAEPVAIDAEKDLALFSINPAAPLTAIRFATALPQPGTPLIGVGNVVRDAYVSLGAYAVSYLDRLAEVISAESKAEIDPERLECSLVMTGSGLNIPGFSGGPLFNELGELVALTSGGDGESYVTAIVAAAARELTDWYRSRISEAKTA